jgi:hypothetical protein
MSLARMVELGIERSRKLRPKQKGSAAHSSPRKQPSVRQWKRSRRSFPRK